MEIFATLIGVGVVAVSPFVAVLRPMAKTAVKGALAVSDVVVGAATLVSHQVHELVAESKAEVDAQKTSETEVPAGAVVVAVSTETQQDSVSTKVPVFSSVSSAVRPVMGAAVKGGMGVADKAKGAAAAAGKQLSNLVPDTKSKPTAEPAVITEVPVENSEIISTPTSDDLTLIKGIGPKSAELLHTAGISTFVELAAADEAQLRQLLAAKGGRFKVIDPSSWPEQAQQMSTTA